MALSERIAETVSLEAFENASWGVLDFLHLGDFFDRHNIPPQIFTLALIILILLGIFLMLPHPAARPGSLSFCGDGVCSPSETYNNCPADCSPSSRLLTVKVDPQAQPGNYKVDLYDKDGKRVSSQRATNSQPAVFDASGMDYVNAVVTDPDGGTWNTGPIRTPWAGPSPDIPPDGDGTDGDGTDDGDSGDGDDDGSVPGGPVAPIIIVFPGNFTPGTGNFTLPVSQICLGGYLQNGSILEEAYLAYLMDILGSINLTGVPPATLNTSCADINSDWFLTIEDRVCLTQLFDKTFPIPDECWDCMIEHPAEVCHDGTDNDCDGQMDRDTYDNRLDQFYGSNATPLDACDCSDITPCDMIYDVNGILGIQNNFTDVKRCSAIGLGWSDTYTWRLESSLGCSPSKRGWSLRCAGNVFTCRNYTGGWVWAMNNCSFYPDFDNVCGVRGGIVAYYSFEGGPFDVINNINGRLRGSPALVEGVLGRAYYFDGNSYIHMKDVDGFSPRTTGSLSVSFWVNLTSADYQDGILVAKPQEWAFMAHGTSSATPYRISLTVYDSSGNTTEISFTESSFYGQAVHIVGVIDGNMIYLYKNGVLVSSGVVGSMPRDTKSQLHVGGSSSGDYFKGIIDELMISGRPLSGSEIWKLYQKKA